MLVIAAIVIVTAVAQMCTDPRVSRLFAEKRKLMIAFYALYGAMSVAALIAFVPQGLVAAFGAGAAVLGWIGLGGLAYARFTMPVPLPTKVIYRELAKQIVEFFTTKKPPVDPAVTVEMMGFLEAANRSGANHGAGEKVEG